MKTMLHVSTFRRHKFDTWPSLHLSIVLQDSLRMKTMLHVSTCRRRSWCRPKIQSNQSTFPQDSLRMKTMLHVSTFRRHKFDTWPSLHLSTFPQDSLRMKTDHTDLSFFLQDK